MTTEVINVELVRTNVFIRWPCSVCGGCTEKVSVLAEAEIECAGGHSITFRVCERCLEEAAINERLEQQAQALAARSEWLRGLIGRLHVPTFADWQKRMQEVEDWWKAEFGIAATDGWIIDDDAPF